ncbi:MAG: PKD domain-containing protein, partial [Bacteroidales bacterium]|nr:PKD domain-containing protein [Bacteroidales bacterium]
SEKLYNVSLRVRNNAGCTDNSTIPVRVYPGVTASFTPDVDQTICEGASLNFVSNSIVNGTTNHPQFTSWNFGDGLTSNLQTVSHTFNNDDTQNSRSYTVNLTVSNIHGCSDSETRTVNVHPKLTNGFTMQMDGNCTPFNVTFTPTGVGATQYQWTFDGLFPNENRTNGTPFTYQADNSDPDNIKTHTISLITSNANGNCVSQPVTKTLTVYPHVVPQASALSQFACPGSPIEFTNSSTGGNLLYYWDFADGQSFATTLQDNITHDFDNRTSTDKPFNVTLWATNANGCSKSVEVPVTIHPRVEADFTMLYDSICVPFNVNFTNTSLNGTNFSWDYGYSLGGVPQQQTTARPTLSHVYTFDNDLPNTIIKPTITLTATQSHTNSGLTCSSAKSVP